MKRFGSLFIVITIFTTVIAAQKTTASPTQAAVEFYRALKDKHYVEGFRRSVYRGAIEGLSSAELKELEPDFAATFSEIPEKIEARGEQITGDTAIVSLKFDGTEELQQVALIRVGGEWLVGDREAFEAVTAQGRNFFFNTRIAVNEDEAFKMLARMLGAEVIYYQKFDGRCAPLQELIRLGGVPRDIEGGQANGYRFTFALGEDQKSFFATATPIVYGKTGRLSFYADLSAVRAEDLKGQPASASSPVYQPK
ncbi:MAG TPA: hypothetical protein VNN73_13610 [Blastocatellia bacterium]|nr:hypothetical protein [Blastocatellia bacterium]